MKEAEDKLMDTKQIPKGHLCYDENKDCPYWRIDNNISADFYGFGRQHSVWCDFLNVNSAAKYFESVYEDDYWKYYRAHLLNDMVKTCGIND